VFLNFGIEALKWRQGKYLDLQETHHRSLNFQDEYRRFLKGYGVAYDEGYVWD